MLRVQGAFAEPGADPAAVAAALAEELREMAAWMELDRVAVARKGDLARALGRAVTASRPHILEVVLPVTRRKPCGSSPEPRG